MIPILKVFFLMLQNQISSLVSILIMLSDFFLLIKVLAFLSKPFSTRFFAQSFFFLFLRKVKKFVNQFD